MHGKLILTNVSHLQRETFSMMLQDILANLQNCTTCANNPHVDHNAKCDLQSSKTDELKCDSYIKCTRRISMHDLEITHEY
jgi:hypothetical protein